MLLKLELCVMFLVLTSPCLGQTAHVRLLSLDSGGESTETSVIRFLGDNRQDFSAKFKGIDADGIPFGTYTIVLRYKYGPPAADFTFRRKIDSQRTLVLAVDPRNVIVGDGLVVAADSLAPPSIRLTGAVSIAKPQRKSLWVRLQAVFAEEKPLETYVDDEQKFFFEGPTSGLYVLSVFNGGKLLHSRIVNLPADFGATPILVTVPDVKQ